METHIPLTDLPRKIRAQGYDAVSYRAFYNAVLDGHITAEKNSAGRWIISTTDLPAIADAMGLAHAAAA